METRLFYYYLVLNLYLLIHITAPFSNHYIIIIIVVDIYLKPCDEVLRLKRMAPCEPATLLTRKLVIRDRFPTFWEDRNIFKINISRIKLYSANLAYNFVYIDLSTYLDLRASHQDILILYRNQTSVTVPCRKIPASATAKSYLDGHTRFRPRSFQPPRSRNAAKSQHLFPSKIFPLPFRRYGFVASTGI